MLLYICMYVIITVMSSGYKGLCNYVHALAWTYSLLCSLWFRLSFIPLFFGMTLYLGVRYMFITFIGVYYFSYLLLLKLLEIIVSFIYLTWIYYVCLIYPFVIWFMVMCYFPHSLNKCLSYFIPWFCYFPNVFYS